jgi:hypothetical protein
MTGRPWKISIQSLGNDGSAIGRPQPIMVDARPPEEPIPVLDCSNILQGTPGIPSNEASKAESDLIKSFYEKVPWAVGDARREESPAPSSSNASANRSTPWWPTETAWSAKNGIGKNTFGSWPRARPA